MRAETKTARARFREHVQGPGPDRWLSPEIETAVEFVASGAAVAATGITLR